MQVQHITSRQNERVKEAAKLRHARQRARQGRLLIEGARQITRALDANLQIDEAFVCQPLVDSEEKQGVADRLLDASVNCATVSEEVYAKLAFGDLEDGLVVVAKTPERRLSDLQLPAQPVVAVLEGLEKPGNIGAILRTADAAGLDAVIVADGQTDLFNPNTIRASLGIVFAANVCSATSEATLNQLRAWQLPIFATRPDAQQFYTEVSYRQGAAMILGSEARGLSPKWQVDEVQAVRLPMHGVADSLNVSVTAAIMFYEALRQRSD